MHKSGARGPGSTRNAGIVGACYRYRLPCSDTRHWEIKVAMERYHCTAAMAYGSFFPGAGLGLALSLYLYSNAFLENIPVLRPFLKVFWSWVVGRVRFIGLEALAPFPPRPSMRTWARAPQ
jgi:hypothetical protein